MSRQAGWNWGNVAFLSTTPFLGLALVAAHVRFEGLSWASLGIFVLFYGLTGMSITGGYHRLFSHRAYQASPLVRAFYLFFGAGAFQNSALKWCTDHRRHHTCVDTENDPYNIHEGFWYAHIIWVLRGDDPRFAGKFAKDLLADPLVMFQHRFYVPLAVLAGIVLPTLLGWSLGIPLGGLALGGIFRLVLVQHSTFLVNSLSHWAGSRPYSDAVTARDNWFTALITFGEGYHNFHHHFQNDYRNAIRWFQYDPTKWFIYSLNRLGLVTDLRRTPAEQILKARLRMEAKAVEQKLAQRQVVYDLRKKLVSAAESLEQRLNQIQSLKQAIRQGKAQGASHVQESLDELRAKIERLYQEYRQELVDWRNHCRIALAQSASVA